MSPEQRLPRSRKLASEYGIGLAFAVELVLFSPLSPHFLTADNLLNVSLQTSITAIIAVGMTFVILTAGIDLSVSSLVAVVGVLTTLLLAAVTPLGVALPLALLAGLALGAFSGLIAGTVITRFSITPFIVTLALMTIWRGTAFILTGGRPIWELPEEFSVLSSGRIIGVPIPTFIMFVVYLVAHVVLTRTRFGRHVYAVGGNAEAARLAGIRTDRVVMGVFVLCGTLSALSGILLASRVNSGQPNAGLSYELDVIAAVVMTLFCRMLGTLLGAGVPLINGLNVARRSFGNQILVDTVSSSIEQVKEGKALGPSLAECRSLFAGSAVEMISVAEESSKLDQELVRIANVTEGDLDQQLKTAVAFAEPLMLFGIAAFIGTIFIGMVIPIFTLQDYIK